MGLEYTHRALVGASFSGKKLFDGVNLTYSYNTGTITKDSDGLLFTSSGSATWFLFAQATGDPTEFSTFGELKGHKLKVDADLEWIDTAANNAKLIISLGIYSYPDPSYGIRVKYRDLSSDESNNFNLHISDTFISDYDAYSGGSTSTGLDNYYFVYKIFLNSPSGGSCRIKRFNVYDLGEKE